MDGTQLLRLLVNQRLKAAAEEIFGLVEQTIAGYEDEAVRSKREIYQLKKQIEQLTVLKPGVMLYREDPNTISVEVLTPPQPGQLPLVAGNEIHDCQQVKEEPVDICIFTEQRDESRDDMEVPLSEFETTRTDCELPPTVGTMNMTYNDEDAWIGSYVSSDTGPSQVHTAFREQEQTQKVEKDCRVCGDQFNNDSELIKHMDETHNGEKAFKCSFCAKEFARKGYLTVHLRVHTGEKPHKCPLCTKTFTDRSNFNAHFRRHMGENSYFCKLCGKLDADRYHYKTCRLKET